MRLQRQSRLRFLLTSFIAWLIVLGLTGVASANTIGMNIIAKPVTRERIATLPKNQQKAWLGDFVRSEKQKAMDKQSLADGQKAACKTKPKHESVARGM